MTPEEELQVIVKDAARYKGVAVDLPKPIVDYIAELLEERRHLRARLDFALEDSGRDSLVQLGQLYDLT